MGTSSCHLVVPPAPTDTLHLALCHHLHPPLRHGRPSPPHHPPPPPPPPLPCANTYPLLCAKGDLADLNHRLAHFFVPPLPTLPAPLEAGALPVPVLPSRAQRHLAPAGKRVP